MSAQGIALGQGSGLNHLPCKGNTSAVDLAMSQSLAKNIVHLVFATKNRQPWLRGPIGPRSHAYLAGIFKEWESPAIVVGGHDDHIHALFVLNKNHALIRVVEEVKKGSSKWIKTLDPHLTQFTCQNGYGAFSVSESNIPDVRRYIEQQAAHHSRMSFQDEFRQLCARHGIEIDERYVWE